MDHEYSERSQAKPRDSTDKTSEERNHRVSGEGTNGSGVVPVASPLKLIINSNDQYENGFSFPSSKNSYNHLLEEDFTKAALNAVHGRSSAAPASLPSSLPAHSSLPSTSSSVIHSPFTSPPRGLGGRQEENQRRQNVVEKINRMRKYNQLESFVPQMDTATANQLCTSMRRNAKKDNSGLPEAIRQFIVDGTEGMQQTTPTRKNEGRKKVDKRGDDPDETDYEDLEADAPCSSSFSSSRSNRQWVMERAQFIVNDSKIGDAIEMHDEKIKELTMKLNALESADSLALQSMIDSERDAKCGGCARLIPWTRIERRTVIKRNLIDELPSTSRETEEGLGVSSSFLRQCEQYLHRISVMPSFHVRKNKNKSIFMNTRELEEEKGRNGVSKREQRERREKRKMEKAEREEEEEKSDSYEETDDDEDEEFVAPEPGTRKTSNGTPKDKKRKRDRERKRSRKERPNRIGGGRRSSDCAPSTRLSSTSRPSFDRPVDLDLTGDPSSLTSTNSTVWLANFREMIVNFKYKEIEVPTWAKAEKEVGKEEERPIPQDFMEFSTESMMAKIAELHHPLEFEERRRCQVARSRRERERDRREAAERAAEGTAYTAGEEEEGERESRERSFSLRGESEDREETERALPPPQRDKTVPLPPPIPPFDYEQIRPVSNYERASLEPPYEKRHFCRSP